MRRGRRTGQWRCTSIRNVRKHKDIRLFGGGHSGSHDRRLGVRVNDRTRHVTNRQDLRAFYERASSTIAGTLFFLLTFVIVPVILRTFVRLQVRIGNAELRMVTSIQQHECAITYVVWGIIAAFILIMLPTIMEDMRTG